MKRLSLLVISALLLFIACGDSDSPKPDTTGDFALASEGGMPDAGGSDSTAPDTAVADAAVQSPKVVTPQRASEIIKDGQCTIIDLREPSELPPTGIIEGALKLPYNSGTFNSAYSTAVPNKDACVMLYCASGNRSSQAAKA